MAVSGGCRLTDSRNLDAILVCLNMEREERKEKGQGGIEEKREGGREGGRDGEGKRKTEKESVNDRVTLTFRAETLLGFLTLFPPEENIWTACCGGNLPASWLLQMPWEGADNWPLLLVEGFNSCNTLVAFPTQ